MSNSLKLGKYQHYKGNFYEVIGIAKHSETLEEMVVYKALYGAKELWVRPKKMFLETVIVDNYFCPASKKVPRFKYVGK